YDAFHENKDTIYRVVQRTKNRAGEYSYPSNSALPLGPTLREEFPEVTQYLRCRPRSNIIVRSADDAYYKRVLLADPTLFEMFTFPLVAGHPESVLSNPGSVVITSELAQVFFGEEPPLGKRLTLEIWATEKDFFVTGVAKSPPSNSTIQFDLVVRLDEQIRSESWGNASVQTYVQLNPNADPAALDSKLLTFTQEHYGTFIERRQSMEGAFGERFGLSEDEDAMTQQLQPLREVYLHLPWIEGAVTRGKPVYSFILFGIA
ncbi:unnamed protein product, partial [marine sediment metagenome]